MTQLRPYQVNCLDAIKQNAAVTKKQLVVMPTGTGKSHVFAELRSFLKLTKKVLVLAHRDELLTQAGAHLRRANPHITVGLEKAESYAENHCDIVVASVQTLGRANSDRIKRLNPDDYSAIVIDEAHHSTSKSYEAVLNHFGVSKVRGHTKSNILLLGVTATPFRSDKVGMDNVFDKIVFEYNINDAVSDGWLVQPRGRVLRTEVDLDAITPHAGDFTQEEIEAAVNILARNERIIRGFIDYGEERPTIVFCASIAHSRKIAEMFTERGVTAEAVWHDDPRRKSKLTEFKAGKISVLCNAFLLGEGVDIPSVSCIIQARPTKSQLVFVQQSGRGLRLQEDTGNLHDAVRQGVSPLKVDCLIIDVVDNTEKHSLITLASLFGLPSKLNLDGMTAQEAAERIIAAKEKYPDIDLSKLDNINDLAIYVRDINLLQDHYDPDIVKHSKLAWTKVADNRWVLAIPNGSNIAVKETILGEYVATGTGKDRVLKETFGSLREALFYSEQWTGEIFGKWSLKPLKRDATWRSSPASSAQKDLIKRLMHFKNIESLDKLSAGRASDIITTMHNKP